MNENEKFEEEFGIHKGRKWILTQEEMKEITDWIKAHDQRLIEEMRIWLAEELKGVDTIGKCHEEIFQDFEERFNLK